MKLFGRQSKSVEVPPELQPYYPATGQDRAWWAEWWVWAMTAVAVAVIGVVVYLVGPWHSTSHKQPASTSSSKTLNKGAVSQPTSTGANKSSQKSTSTNSNKSQATTQQAPASNNQPTQTSSSNSQLTNTGPGQVVAIFVVTVALGVTACELALKRNIKSS